MIILAYHRVTLRASGSLSVTRADFEEQLHYLLSKGYRNVPVETALEIHASARLYSKTFAITFDDGYRDNYLHAMPVLDKLGLQATVFLPFDYIDTEVRYPWHRKQPSGNASDPGHEDFPLRWEQIEEMRSSGIFAFGSHTLSHPFLTRISLREARQEIEVSKYRLEDRLGTRIRSFCYPAGDLNRSVTRIVRDSGYDLAVVTPPRPLPVSRYTCPRVGVYGGMTFNQFRRHVSAPYHMLTSTGLLPCLRLARRSVARARRQTSPVPPST